MSLTLVIGNKTYSSWSLRPWLLLSHFGIPFSEKLLPLDTDQFRAEIPALSPSGRVPVLHDGELKVWDSLAICEYLNEAYLDQRGWPSDLAHRAIARSVSAEMHSGFAAMRNELAMNVKRVNRPLAQVSAEATADIARVQAIWTDCLERSGGPFLFGDFSIADAMFAPVVYRFRGYGIALSEAQQRYSQAILALPAIAAWEAGAANEPPMPKYEAR